MCKITILHTIYIQKFFNSMLNASQMCNNVEILWACFLLFINYNNVVCNNPANVEILLVVILFLLDNSLIIILIAVLTLFFLLILILPQ